MTTLAAPLSPVRVSQSANSSVAERVLRDTLLNAAKTYDLREGTSDPRTDAVALQLEVFRTAWGASSSIILVGDKAYVMTAADPVAVNGASLGPTRERFFALPKLKLSASDKALFATLAMTVLPKRHVEWKLGELLRARRDVGQGTAPAKDDVLHSVTFSPNLARPLSASNPGVTAHLLSGLPTKIIFERQTADGFGAPSRTFTKPVELAPDFLPRGMKWADLKRS